MIALYWKVCLLISRTLAINVIKLKWSSDVCLFYMSIVFITLNTRKITGIETSYDMSSGCKKTALWTLYSMPWEQDNRNVAQTRHLPIPIFRAWLDVTSPQESVCSNPKQHNAKHVLRAQIVNAWLTNPHLHPSLVCTYSRVTLCNQPWFTECDVMWRDLDSQGV